MNVYMLYNGAELLTVCDSSDRAKEIAHKQHQAPRENAWREYSGEYQSFALDGTDFHICARDLLTERVASPGYVERTLEKVYAKDEALRAHFPMLPDAVVASPHYSRVHEVINHRSALSKISGFWYGYSLGLMSR